jgi:hypothetical protein
MTGSKAGTNPPEQPQKGRLGKMANSVFGTSHVPTCSESAETPAAQPEHMFRRGVPKHAQREEVRAGTEQLPPLEGECCSDPLTPQPSSHDSLSRKLPIAGAACARCERQLTATEPVWRRRIGLGRGFFGGARWKVALFCEWCAPQSPHYRWSAKPCNACGRMVHTDERLPLPAYCCRACELRQQQARMRQRRAEARGATKVCVRCGETFEPVRADAVVCSNACRQKAYRRRVTDRKCGPVCEIANRNAESAEAP